jgi:hypothetical protein
LLQTANCRALAPVLARSASAVPPTLYPSVPKAPRLLETTMDRLPPPVLADYRRTIPADLLTEFDDAHFAPIEELRHEPRVGAPATPLAVDLWTLVQFKSLMLREGWPLQVSRMIFDRVYAHERLAFAHGSANDALRRLAMEIFRRMHADDGAPQGFGH